MAINSEALRYKNKRLYVSTMIKKVFNIPNCQRKALSQNAEKPDSIPRVFTKIDSFAEESRLELPCESDRLYLTKTRPLASNLLHAFRTTESR